MDAPNVEITRKLASRSGLSLGGQIAPDPHDIRPECGLASESVFVAMQWLHYYHLMPVIERFAQCRVRINANDHPPPHFHVVMNDGREALVTIADIKIVHGKVVAREIVNVLAWAEANRNMLADTFEELQR
ncbi:MULTISPECIES: DUF4160 domain-containing protein [unclassified Thiocapsa]|uniref:DUF4160 domain-containing protein n=1 Tax=unclassified Thiocapsa TaxID=2641286 RepID=UPI0035B02E21